MKKISLLLFLIGYTLFPGSLQVVSQDDFEARLCAAAKELTKQKVTYDPSYFSISYPNGDVPADKGVCTDVIIRAYRKVGIDLQKEIHEDIIACPSAYSRNGETIKPDKNIDHRRVPNQQTFFKRHGLVKPVTSDPKDYLPGDIVTWDLGGGVNHIGIVVDTVSWDGKRPMIVHNIGGGQVMEDRLFHYTITGHYTYSK